MTPDPRPRPAVPSGGSSRSEATSGWSAWRRGRPRWRSVGRLITAVVLTRLVLFLVVATATRILPAGFEPRVEAYLGKNLSLAAWIRWDAWWYLSVVERGYWFDPHGKSNVAFFPLFPALVRGVAAMVGNPLVAGLLVANAAALGAILALWWWVEREAGPHAGERAALWLLVYLFSFFFHSLYAESLFFLLATLALGTAARDRWVGAGAWGALAAATRPMGVLLAPALLWGLWRAARGQGRAALGSATSPAPCCPLWAWPPTCSSSGRPSVTRWPSGRRT